MAGEEEMGLGELGWEEEYVLSFVYSERNAVREKEKGGRRGKEEWVWNTRVGRT